MIALGYIYFSGRVAYFFADSLQELQKFEAVKGVGFVLVTGILFFIISLGWWRKTHYQRNLLIQSERRSVTSMYSASLAHDLNNMLTLLFAQMDELNKYQTDDEYFLGLRRSIEESIQRLSRMAKRIAASARELKLDEKANITLSDTIDRVVELAGKHPDVKLCSLETVYIPKVSLLLNRGLLEQAVLNLVINAAQAAGKGGKIKITAQYVNESVVLEIHDNGPGIPLEKAEAVFNVGFTTKKKGCGLGLLSVQAFAASCLARISVDWSPLGGAMFQMRIPLGALAAG